MVYSSQVIEEGLIKGVPSNVWAGLRKPTGEQDQETATIGVTFCPWALKQQGRQRVPEAAAGRGQQTGKVLLSSRKDTANLLPPEGSKTKHSLRSD